MDIQVEGGGAGARILIDGYSGGGRRSWSQETSQDINPPPGQEGYLLLRQRSGTTGKSSSI